MKTINEEIEEELNDFKTKVTKMITSRFKEDHEIGPVVFMLALKDKKWQMGVVGGLEQLFDSDQGKEMAADLLKEANKEMKPLATAFSSEGWMVESTRDKSHELMDDNGRMKVRPMDHPDRVEMLFISFETHNKQCMLTWKIVREDGKDPYLDPIHKDMLTNWVDKTDDNMKGRFTGLLQNNYSEIVQELEKKIKTEVN